MFSTLRYDPQTNEILHIPQSYDPDTARPIQHQACNRCYGKKVRCSGEKSGCERCVRESSHCTYTRPGSSRMPRRGSQRARRRSTGSSRACERPSSPSTTRIPSATRSRSLRDLGLSASYFDADLTPQAPEQVVTVTQPSHRGHPDVLRPLASGWRPEDTFHVGWLGDEYDGRILADAAAASGYMHPPSMNQAYPVSSSGGQGGWVPGHPVEPGPMVSITGTAGMTNSPFFTSSGQVDGPLPPFHGQHSEYQVAFPEQHPPEFSPDFLKNQWGFENADHEG